MRDEEARKLAERLERECYTYSHGGYYSRESDFDIYDATETLAADLARAREEGRREGQKKTLNDVQRWWRCACEIHPVRSQREMNRHQFFMTALNELQYPSALLAEGKKEAHDDM